MYMHVLIFGTFDGFHSGHDAYVQEAYKMGTKVSAVITPDAVVKTLKQYTPRYSEIERSEFLKEKYPTISTIIGDKDVSSWNILETLTPDAVLLGYDQDELAQSIQKSAYVERMQTPILRAKPYKADIYHNSLLHNQ